MWCEKSTGRGENQDVLKLKEIEAINTNFKKLNNEIRKIWNLQKKKLKKCKDTVKTTINEKDINSEDILISINYHRSILDGKHIDIISSSVV